MKTWDEMTILEQYASIYSDMFKDAYGVRPRGVDTSTWTESDFLEQFSGLEKIIREQPDDF